MIPNLGGVGLEPLRHRLEFVDVINGLYRVVLQKVMVAIIKGSLRYGVSEVLAFAAAAADPRAFCIDAYR